MRRRRMHEIKEWKIIKYKDKKNHSHRQRIEHTNECCVIRVEEKSEMNSFIS